MTGKIVNLWLFIKGKERTMRRRRLVLKRRQGEAVDLATSDGLVTIYINKIKGKAVSLVFLAPELVRITRDYDDARRTTNVQTTQ